MPDIKLSKNVISGGDSLQFDLMEEMLECKLCHEYYLQARELELCTVLSQSLAEV